MRILIMSDTHGRPANIDVAIEEAAPIDMLLHLGDVEGDEHIIEELVSCPIHIVAGNNDFFTYLPKEKIIQIGKYKIFMTHGHEYYVSMGTRLLKEEGRARGVDIVMYGHTHRPELDYMDGLVTLNPGSLSYPRQEGRMPSYIVMDIDENDELHFEICYI